MLPTLAKVGNSSCKLGTLPKVCYSLIPALVTLFFLALEVVVVVVVVVVNTIFFFLAVWFSRDGSMVSVYRAKLKSYS